MASLAQTAQINGTLSYFDVYNDSGQDAHGFEIQLEGIQPADLYFSYNLSRYGAPQVIAYGTGVTVRWASSYSPVSGSYTHSTPPQTTTGFSWNDCYSWGRGYATSGCEHFGHSLRNNAVPTRAVARWLIDNPANRGNLIPAPQQALVPLPNYSITPGTTASTAPILVATIPAPAPPPPVVYGDAQWIKVYKTVTQTSVEGNDLDDSNTSVVPQTEVQTEISWDILQPPPPGLNGKKNRNQRRTQGGLSKTDRSVIRRVELYKYTGAYDPTSHEVSCADLVCNAPQEGELGAPLSATNSAANVTVDSVTVTKTGSGAGAATVSGPGISCGGACSIFANNGQALTLTANPGSAVFTGWGGACSGTSATCSVTTNGLVNVTADFKLVYTLSVGRKNSGTITATPDGRDRALNCGGACSAKFMDTTVVTLTAVPPAGKTFVGWSGACSGSTPTCTLTIQRDTSVTAEFSK